MVSIARVRGRYRVGQVKKRFRGAAGDFEIGLVGHPTQPREEMGPPDGAMDVVVREGGELGQQTRHLAGATESQLLVWGAHRTTRR